MGHMEIHYLLGWILMISEHIRRLHLLIVALM